MKLEGYVIEKYNCMSNAYTCHRLVEEAMKCGIDLQIVGIHDTAVTKEEILNAGKVLEKRDFVINRYKWGKGKEAINFLAKKSYNSLNAFACYINKYEQVKTLSSEAFVMPEFLLATALFPWQDMVKILGSPFVAKGLESSMGEQVFLIKNEQELQQLCSRYGSEKEWLFEELITESMGRDIRCYSVRGEVIACMQRKSRGDFRANVALGAEVSAMEITDPIRQAARDIYEQTGLDFLGIDLLFGIKKPYFCEINVMPGIEGIERATGVNVAKRIMETIQGDFISGYK